MTTTIKVSEQVHRKLFNLKTRFEQKIEKQLSFNDVVELLIQQLENVNTNQLINDLMSLKGILTEKDMDYYQEMREIDKKRENRYISR